MKNKLNTFIKNKFKRNKIKGRKEKIHVYKEPYVTANKFNGYEGVLNNGARINAGILEIDECTKHDKEAGSESSLKERPCKDVYYLNIAEQVLTRSTCMRRKYGAVIVKNDRIISTGYNGAPRGDDNCCDIGICEREKHNVPKGERYELCVAIHAEDNAITCAGRDQVIGSTLYIVGKESSTGEYANPSPCKMCARKIKNSGIEKVIGRFMENGKVIDKYIQL